MAKDVFKVCDRPFEEASGTGVEQLSGGFFRHCTAYLHAGVGQVSSRISRLRESTLPNDLLAVDGSSRTWWLPDSALLQFKTGAYGKQRSKDYQMATGFGDRVRYARKQLSISQSGINVCDVRFGRAKRLLPQELLDRLSDLTNVIQRWDRTKFQHYNSNFMTTFGQLYLELVFNQYSWQQLLKLYAKVVVG